MYLNFVKIDVLQIAIDGLMKIKLIDDRQKADLLKRIEQNEEKYELQKKELETLNQYLEIVYEKHILKENDKNKMKEKLSEFINMLSTKKIIGIF